MQSPRALASALYRGEVSYDFVGKRRRWYLTSAIFLVLAAVGLFGRGLNLGIEFKGGAEFSIQSTTTTIEGARTAVEATGVTDPIVTQVGTSTIRVQTPALSTQQADDVSAALAEEAGVTTGDVTIQVVGPTWGSEITSKALQGLGIFLLLLLVFLTIYFEWRMAVAAMVALVHDMAITVGIYALTGFEVTPATVIGFLTILGFSLYDTVVVFDKVKENTRGITAGNRTSYSEAANLALNQTLVRSINTSIVALLPVASILLVGVVFLGAGTLKDLALALFVGTLVGTYSSIFIATPFLAWLKEMEPANQALAKRVELRRSGRDARKSTSQSKARTATAVLEPDTSVEAAPEAVVAPTTSGSPARPAQPRPNRPPQQRKKKRKR